MADAPLPIEPVLRQPRFQDTRTRWGSRVADILIRSIVPVLLALVAGGILLAALGRNPFSFYSDIWKYGVANGNWQQSAVTMIPMLLIAVGLIVVFRANLWNLGYNGQFALAAACVAGYGPSLVNDVPLWLAFTLLFLMAGAVGAAWAFIPGFLKAYYGTNEIITTLMMTFIGIDLADYLIKNPFQDPSIQTPQTTAIAFDKLLPPIPGTSIDVSLLVAFAAVIVVHYVLTRTAFGLRLHVLGANPRAARHVGIKLPQLTIAAFLISGALIGAAAAAYVLSPFWGYVRADQNPHLRRLDHPLRLPGAAERARRRPLRRLLRRAFDRRRLRDLASESPDRLPARPRRTDPPVHDDHRVSRPTPRARKQLSPRRPRAGAAHPAPPPYSNRSGCRVNQLFWTTVISGGLLAGVPLMFTALGESISERAGVLNIGLEGMMLVGAYCGYLGTYYSNSIWVGFLTGIAGGVGSSVIMAVLCVRLGLDQIVVGIAITLAGEGITSVLYQSQFSHDGTAGSERRRRRRSRYWTRSRSWARRSTARTRSSTSR